MKKYDLEVISLTKGSNGSELFINGECYAIKTEKIDKIAEGKEMDLLIMKKQELLKNINYGLVEKIDAVKLLVEDAKKE